MPTYTQSKSATEKEGAVSDYSDYSVEHIITRCTDFKSAVKDAKYLNKDEKTWLTAVLDAQIDCLNEVTAINETGVPAGEADLKLQRLFIFVSKKANELQKFVLAGVKSSDDTTCKEFQAALIAFSKQKPIADKLIKDCEPSLSKLIHLKECLAKVDKLLADNRYNANANVLALFKTDTYPGMLGKIIENHAGVKLIAGELIYRHSSLKARVTTDAFASDLKEITTIYTQYNALPQSQVKVLNQTGAFKTATAATSTPQPDRRRAIAANGQ